MLFYVIMYVSWFYESNTNGLISPCPFTLRDEIDSCVQGLFSRRTWFIASVFMSSSCVD